MPVLTNEKHRALSAQLSQRIDALMRVMGNRPLKNSNEGIRRGSWVRPDQMCATKGSGLDLRMAVEDFKAILAEIKKLK